MTKPIELFRPGKRYRGFLQEEEDTFPLTFNVYPLGDKNLRLKYIFPAGLLHKIREGYVIFALIEDRDFMIAELRIVEKEKGALLASLDFVTKDRRKLPRIRVENMDIKAELECEGKSLEGKVLDLSVTSLAVSSPQAVENVTCTLTILYRGRKFRFNSRVMKSYNHKVVLSVEDGSFTSFVSRVYSDLLLKVQRST